MMKNLSGREGDHNFKAYLGTDRYRALVNTDLVMSNSPIGQKIYFAVGTPLVYEHRNMKEKLTTIGERFEERTKTIQERTVGLFRRRRIEEKGYLVFGSTVNREVISSIFESYISWYGFSWPFVFCVAKEEPLGWRDLLQILPE